MSTVLSQHPRFTPRLVLRPFRRRDAGPLHDAVAASLPELSRWLPWAANQYSRTVAQQFVRDSIAAWSEARAYDFAVRCREDSDRHIGNVSVWWVSRANMTGELGYWVRTDGTSRGVATEATARALEVAFEELSMHRVALRIAVGNRPSERIAEKLGFLQEGLLRDEVKVGSKWLDHTVWGLLEQEWRVERERYATEAWM